MHIKNWTKVLLCPDRALARSADITLLFVGLGPGETIMLQHIPRIWIVGVRWSRALRKSRRRIIQVRQCCRAIAEIRFDTWVRSCCGSSGLGVLSIFQAIPISSPKSLDCISRKSGKYLQLSENFILSKFSESILNSLVSESQFCNVVLRFGRGRRTYRSWNYLSKDFWNIMPGDYFRVFRFNQRVWANEKITANVFSFHISINPLFYVCYYRIFYAIFFSNCSSRSSTQWFFWS